MVWLIGFFELRKEKEPDDFADEFEYEARQRTQKTVIWRMLGIATFVVTLLAFLITQDLSLPMAIFDKWSILMAVLLTAQIIFGLLMRRKKIEPQDDEKEFYSA